MKITQARLKEIIKEEIARMSEDEGEGGADERRSLFLTAVEAALKNDPETSSIELTDNQKNNLWQLFAENMDVSVQQGSVADLAQEVVSHVKTAIALGIFDRGFVPD